MIKNLIFDLGGVLVSLDRKRCLDNFSEKLGFDDFGEYLNPYAQKGFFAKFENGDIDAAQFRDTVREHCTKEGVTDDNTCCYIHAQSCVQTNNGVEQCAAGFDAGCSVYGISHQEYNSTDDLQRTVGGLKAVGKILGNGDRVISCDRISAQTWSLHKPADGVAYAKTDSYPSLT